MLARILGGGRDALVRVDCQNLQGSGSGWEANTLTWRLLGVAPGYKGHVPGCRDGLLVRVRDFPECVLLFDEFEKADSTVGRLILRILDEGKAQDSEGTEIDFRRCVVVLTSNAGVTYNDPERGSIVFGPASSTPEPATVTEKTVSEGLLATGLGQEFLGRVQHLILFHTLTAEHIAEIIGRQLRQLEGSRPGAGQATELDGRGGGAPGGAVAVASRTWGRATSPRWSASRSSIRSTSPPPAESWATTCAKSSSTAHPGPDGRVPQQRPPPGGGSAAHCPALTAGGVFSCRISVHSHSPGNCRCERHPVCETGLVLSVRRPSVLSGVVRRPYLHEVSHAYTSVPRPARRTAGWPAPDWLEAGWEVANGDGRRGGWARPPPAGVDVQARGPIHEAYAEPTNTVEAPAEVVAKEPPAPIEETPPEEKPEGDNVVWIPGYWSWDEETKDYLWISGFWRAVPPGRTGRRATGRRWTPAVSGCPVSGASPRP